MRLRIFLLVLLVGCSGGQKHDDPAPVIRPQPGADKCDIACEAMRSKLTGPDGGVGCEVALPVPVQEGGTVECEPDAGAKECISCEQWCEEQHANGILWNTECIAEQITTCEEVETVCNIQ